MDQYELKARCLALPGAVEDFPFGDEASVFKAGGKMFALCAPDGEPPQAQPPRRLPRRRRIDLTPFRNPNH